MRLENHRGLLLVDASVKVDFTIDSTSFNVIAGRQTIEVGSRESESDAPVEWSTRSREIGEKRIVFLSDFRAPGYQQRKRR
jgi:hypothetical protein